MLDYPSNPTGEEKKEFSIHLRIPEFLSVPETFKLKGSQRVVLLLPNGSHASFSIDDFLCLLVCFYLILISGTL